MEKYSSISFQQLLGSFLIIMGIVFALLSLLRDDKSHATRLFAIVFIAALSLFSNNLATYFASLFIIAIAVTELDFLQNLAAILRGGKNYFDQKKAVQGKNTSNTPHER